MTETTIINYQERAARTMPLLGTKAQDGAHMAMGITTELGEMVEAIEKDDLVNVREEHGDCNWYIANICNIYGLDFNDVFNKAVTASNFSGGDFMLHELVDIFKRELAYKKTVDLNKLEEQLVILIVGLIDLADAFEFPYNESLDLNIKKLYARYPEKFTEEDALNRDLDKEDSVLQGS